MQGCCHLLGGRWGSLGSSEEGCIRCRSNSYGTVGADLGRRAALGEVLGVVLGMGYPSCPQLAWLEARHSLP